MRGSKKRFVHVVALLLSVVIVASCQPPDRPSVGRGTPVKRVFVLGDSITHGLFGTTPRVHELIDRRMRERGVQLSIGGFAGENVLDVWQDHPRWIDVMRERVQNFNPDMIVIQSTLFPNAGPRQNQYLAAMRELLDVAQSRGAHVYFVKHTLPPEHRMKQRIEAAVAEQLQGTAGARRGISWIPLDKWLGACDRPVSSDGWHLSGNGQRCHADAVTAAVDQLRRANA